MSAAKLFPPYEHVHPTALVEALEALSKLHSGSGMNNAKRWERLLEKVRNGERLSPFEIIQIGCNSSLIPAELQEKFAKLFRIQVNEDILQAVSQSVSIQLAPSEAIALLTHQEILDKFGRDHLPNGVFIAAEHLARDPEELEWINSELAKNVSVSSLIHSFSVMAYGSALSPGQKRILRSTLTASRLHLVLNKQFEEIYRLLGELKSESTDCLLIVDEMLGQYFAADSSWTTKVLDEKFFLATLLSRIPELAPEKTRMHLYKNIELLRKKVNELNDVLKMLNDVEPNRGNFWRRYLSQCHYVEPKRLDKGSVATAFAFPNFVIVEFAPVGTSALLYERSAFDSEVRSTKNWRNLDFVKPFPPYTNDGRLLHMANWERRFNEVIVLLLRNAGSFR